MSARALYDKPEPRPRGAPLPGVGRALRFSKKGDERALTDEEIWLVPSVLKQAGERLLELGDAGVGGFVDGGLDRGEIWLLRSIPRRTLAAAMRAAKGRWSPAAATALSLRIATGLSALEKRSLAIGPLAPDGVGLAGDRVQIMGDALVGAMVGAASARHDGSVSPEYIPPAQANGAPWDFAANRYVLGLILYRLLSGAHPFAGAGLRHALGEAQHREVPPFADAVAESLPPGLQSFVLRMLDPDPGGRPQSAKSIADTLATYAGEDLGEQTLESGTMHSADHPARQRAASASRAGAEVEIVGHGAPPTERAPHKKRPNALAWIQAALPVAVGGAITWAALAELAPAPKAEAHHATVRAASALTEEHTSAKDCASCHPRQTAEWRRSVMGHAVKSPLFNALESLVEEQVGRDNDCPNGAGILRKVDPTFACRDRKSGLVVSGAGGEHWCVNCHSPGENLDAKMPAWQGTSGGDPHVRAPVRDLLGANALEGVSCGFCHQVHGPVSPGSRYQGNPSWLSFETGAVFASRPEDQRGTFGIANSGYDLDPGSFLFGSSSPYGASSPVAHRRTDPHVLGYLQSSEFCGSCHDVRLFGTDSLAAARSGGVEHFKRLRNAYSEWTAWADLEKRKGKKAATCQDCHMSTFPGVCASGGTIDDPSCPTGTKLEERAPGSFPDGFVAAASTETSPITTHYLSGVDLPLSREYPEALIDEDTLDVFGLPISARKRRDLLLRRTFRFDVRPPTFRGQTLEIPIEIENLRAGHRVPAGFSQEREFWVHLRVTDASGRVVYEVGRVDRASDDLADKIFERVSTSPDFVDSLGRPLGMFGADVRDGPDKPEWVAAGGAGLATFASGATSFRGKGLINLQNGFLRCVRCIGVVGDDGTCQPGPGQGVFRADRFDDGAYDQDTGECRSNLAGTNAFFETYFPVGALDASRGVPKAPDAIIDTRSAAPEVPLSYTYALDLAGARPPLRVDAELQFRAFPPYLVKAFAAYEAEQARRGLRPSGPLVDTGMLKRLEVVTLNHVSVTTGGAR